MVGDTGNQSGSSHHSLGLGSYLGLISSLGHSSYLCHPAHTKQDITAASIWEGPLREELERRLAFECLWRVKMHMFGPRRS